MTSLSTIAFCTIGGAVIGFGIGVEIGAGLKDKKYTEHMCKSIAYKTASDEFLNSDELHKLNWEQSKSVYSTMFNSLNEECKEFIDNKSIILPIELTVIGASVGFIVGIVRVIFDKFQST